MVDQQESASGSGSDSESFHRSLFFSDSDSDSDSASDSDSEAEAERNSGDQSAMEQLASSASSCPLADGRLQPGAKTASRNPTASPSDIEGPPTPRLESPVEPLQPAGRQSSNMDESSLGVDKGREIPVGVLLTPAKGIAPAALHEGVGEIPGHRVRGPSRAERRAQALRALNQATQVSEPTMPQVSNSFRQSLTENGLTSRQDRPPSISSRTSSGLRDSPQAPVDRGSLKRTDSEGSGTKSLAQRLLGHFLAFDSQKFDDLAEKPTEEGSRPRIFGGVLKHPLVRLSGQCTKIGAHEPSPTITKGAGRLSPLASWRNGLEPLQNLGRSGSAEKQPVTVFSSRSAPPSSENTAEGGSSPLALIRPSRGRRSSSAALGLAGSACTSPARSPPRSPRMAAIRSAVTAKMKLMSPLDLAQALPEDDAEERLSPSRAGAAKKNFSTSRNFSDSISTLRSVATSSRAEDDEEEVRIANEKSNEQVLAFYCRLGSLLGILLPDLVAFAIFHIIRAPDLCKGVLSGSDATRGDLDDGVVGLLSVLVALHILFLVCEMRGSDSYGGGSRWSCSFLSTSHGNSKLITNVLYAASVILSVLFMVLHARSCTSSSQNPHADGASVVSRLHLVVHGARILCLFAFCTRLQKHFRLRLQTVVSVNKRRFVDKETHLDLDLSYICDRLIAMALPCARNALYRNDIREVARFFASRHYGSFIVTNLCNSFEQAGNGSYDPSLLYKQVQRLPYNDHHAPPMHVLLSFLEAATAYLNEAPANVVAVHCRGGKGRTGTFCSALLLWVGACGSAEEAMHLFASRRTQPLTHKSKQPMQGVDSPSQKRYIAYLERIIYDGVDLYAWEPVVLSKITLHTVPMYALEKFVLVVIVEERGRIVFDSGKADGGVRCDLKDGGMTPYDDLEIEIPLLILHGDVTVRVFHLDETALVRGASGRVGPGGMFVRYNSIKGKMVAFCQLHTAFHSQDITFAKHELDRAYSDRSNRDSLPQFRLSLALACARSSDMQAAVQGQLNHALSPMTILRSPSLMDEEEDLQAVVQRLCPRVERYRKGEVVFDSRQCQGRQLLLVQSGQAGYSQVAKRNTHMYGQQVLGISRYCAFERTVGSRALLGAGEFLFGADASPYGTILKAKTEQLAVYRVDLGDGGLCIPCDVAGVSMADQATLFRAVAKERSYASAKLATKLAYLTEMQNVVHDSGSSNTLHEKAMMVQQLYETYKIPVIERVVSIQDAILQKLDKAVEGKLVLFTNWLIFCAAGVRLGESENNDVVMDMRRISHTSVNGGALTVCLSDAWPLLSSTEREIARHSKISNSAESTVSEAAPELHKSPTLVAFDLHRSLDSIGAKAIDMTKAIGATTKSILGRLAHTPAQALSGAAGDSAMSWGQSRLSVAAIQSQADAPSTPQHGIRRGRRFSSAKKDKDSVVLAVEDGVDRTFVIKEGSEVCKKVHDAIQKQLQMQNPTEPLPELHGATHFPVLAHFGFVLPGEELGEDERVPLGQLLSPVRRRKFCACTNILHEGDLDRAVFLILSGKVSRRTRRGAVLAVFQSGELVGDRSFWEHGNRGLDATLHAETDVELQVLNYEDVQIVCAGKPSLSARIYRSLAICVGKRIQRQLQQLRQVEEPEGEGNS